MVIALLSMLVVMPVPASAAGTQTSTAGTPARARRARPAIRITLEDAYKEARAHAPELKAAAERVVQSEINVDRAWSLLKPTWNLVVTYTHVEPAPEPITFPDFEAVRNICAQGTEQCVQAFMNLPVRTFDFATQDTVLLSTRIQWNILNGRALPLLKNARDAVAVERDEQAQRERALLLGVARAYYAAAATSQAIEAAERALSRSLERSALEEKRAAVGEESPARMRASAIADRQARLDVTRAELAHAAALAGLALILGRTEPVDVLPPPEPEPPAEDEPALVRAALDRRDDVQAARTAVTIAERTLDEAWWKFAPTVGLFGGYRYSNVGGITGQKDEWSFGVVGTVLLYDGGLRYQDIAEAESKIRAAKNLLEGLTARVEAEIRQARLKVESAALAVERAQTAIDLAKERLALTETQLSAGAAREIEVRDATDAVGDAERLLIRAIYDRSVAILELRSAAGE